MPVENNSFPFNRMQARPADDVCWQQELHSPGDRDLKGNCQISDLTYPISKVKSAADVHVYLCL